MGEGFIGVSSDERAQVNLNLFLCRLAIIINGRYNYNTTNIIRLENTYICIDSFLIIPTAALHIVRLNMFH